MVEGGTVYVWCVIVYISTVCSSLDYASKSFPHGGIGFLHHSLVEKPANAMLKALSPRSLINQLLY